jgi:DNA topoisomerase-6 subunit A
MAIPKAKFIGLSSADPDAYGLSRNVGIKLNDKDVSRAKCCSSTSSTRWPTWTSAT